MERRTSGALAFAVGRVGQVTEVEQAGVVVLAASLFEDGGRVVRKRKARELLTTTDLVPGDLVSLTRKVGCVCVCVCVCVCALAR